MSRTFRRSRIRQTNGKLQFRRVRDGEQITRRTPKRKDKPKGQA